MLCVGQFHVAMGDVVDVGEGDGGGSEARRRRGNEGAGDGVLRREFANVSDRAGSSQIESFCTWRVSLPYSGKTVRGKKDDIVLR